MYQKLEDTTVMYGRIDTTFYWKIQAFTYVQTIKKY